MKINLNDQLGNSGVIGFFSCNTIMQLAMFIILSAFAGTMWINQGGKSEALMLLFTLSLASILPKLV